ncbi:MAG: DUF4136 domain-containing protein [Candidatus Kapabacteria bacterium]|nr:DUF4136 domain-containing protein [Candidatus Kapabacteria bacterium]
MPTVQRMTIWALGLSSIVLISVSCYPTHGLAVEDFDTVVTGYVPANDFTKYRTFFMPDTIIHVDKETSQIVTRKYDALILSTIATNMSNMGYTRVTDTLVSDPDVRLYLAVTATTFETYYGGGWGGYWGWYGGYYPPYYGGYYGSVSYDVGALAVDMLDRRVVAGGKTGAIVWGSTLSGLVGGGISNSYLTGKLNQMFTQSPYLATGATK